MTPNRNRVYMRDQVIVLDTVSRRKTVLMRDAAHYFMNIFSFLRLNFIFLLRYKSLCEQYAQKTKTQRTKKFWIKQFDK